MAVDRIECPVAGQIECTCPKADCPRRGLCCECVRSHRERVEDPPIKRLPHCVRHIVAEYLE